MGLLPCIAAGVTQPLIILVHARFLSTPQHLAHARGIAESIRCSSQAKLAQ